MKFIIRLVRGISGAAGFLLLLGAVFLGSRGGPDISGAGILAPLLSAPGAGALIGLFLLWLHFALSGGYKRLPFLFLAAAGSTLVFAALGIGAAGGLARASWDFAGGAGGGGMEIPGGAGGSGMEIPGGPEGGVIRDWSVLLSGFVLLAGARMALACPVLHRRRFLFLVSAAALGAVFLPALSRGNLESGRGRLAYRGELDSLVSMLHPGYRNYGEEEVEEFLEELSGDAEIDGAEKMRIIEELNGRITELEENVRRFEKAREGEISGDDDEIARLKKLLEENFRIGVSDEDLRMVSGYREAVRPSAPIVRDFAVRLASAHPGSYYASGRSDGIPGREGLMQILTIHRYVSENWKYVNDPLFIQGNYYSPADRTIALGLAGDCDDFASLMASLIEAIGGRVRILHGSCSDGGHAWCEVYIGGRPEWEKALTVLRREFPGRTISFIPPSGGSGYWLSLDWQAGVHTCGGSPSVHYQSGGTP